MNLPLVSICLPTLNARQFLEPRMQTVLSQTLTDWELIVCDSYSDDGTWEYLQQFKDDPRVRLYQVPKDGLYAGWNECLRRCRGEYVYIATADDTCEPELLEKMVAALEAAKTTDCRPQTADLEAAQTADCLRGKASGEDDAEQGLRSAVCGLQFDPKGLQSVVCGLQSGLPADIAVCNFDYIDANGAIIDPPLPPAGAFYGDDRYRAHRRSGYLEFLVHLLIGTSWTTMTAVVFRRALLENTGLFRADVPGVLADRLWAYKSALRSDTIVVPETLATWRQHSEQGSAPLRGKRTLKDTRNIRALWRAIVETVDECVPLLPSVWQNVPELRDKLLWSERRHYYDLYHLNRTCLRYSLRKFLDGVCKATVLEPCYLARRLFCLLAWERDAGLVEGEHLTQLLRDWNVVRGNL